MNSIYSVSNHFFLVFPYERPGCTGAPTSIGLRGPTSPIGTRTRPEACTGQFKLRTLFTLFSSATTPGVRNVPSPHVLMPAHVKIEPRFFGEFDVPLPHQVVLTSPRVAKHLQLEYESKVATISSLAVLVFLSLDGRAMYVCYRLAISWLSETNFLISRALYPRLQLRLDSRKPI